MTKYDAKLVRYHSSSKCRNAAVIWIFGFVVPHWYCYYITSLRVCGVCNHTPTETAEWLPTRSISVLLVFNRVESDVVWQCDVEIGTDETWFAVIDQGLSPIAYHGGRNFSENTHMPTRQEGLGNVRYQY